MRALVFLAVVTLWCPTWSYVAADQQRISIRSDGDAPVIFYSRLHYRVADVEQHQELSIYADGRVRVFTPSYMVNPGTFEYSLSDKGMQSLLAKLDGHNLMKLDVRALKTKRDQALRNRIAAGAERFHVSDFTAAHIKLNFSSFAHGAQKGTAIDSDIVWRNLAFEADKFKDLTELRQLADAEQVLLQLMDHSRRNSVKLTGGQ